MGGDITGAKKDYRNHGAKIGNNTVFKNRLCGLLIEIKAIFVLMQKKDIKTREDVYLLVSSFYEKIRVNKELGPFFNETIKDWDVHLDNLTTFWESSLFLKTRYIGNPLEVHVEVDKAHGHAITERHFGLWLNLWIQTIDGLFEGDYAENAKRRARKMATFLYLKIFEARSN
ncbi:group III truncated hemoglobin [Aestuariivivens sp. NBU2969]|uniref:group III truncated hemoglobin n=1 Tax=Aestuariivivens sp. NBU2969 TaxID=2873267 RepID=UPI00351CBFEA